MNAAFTHPGPFGRRFNDSRRGAWYAGVEFETSIHEVAFHKRRFLEDGRISERLSFDYADFLADFSGQFHFLDDVESQQCLQPEPIPQCYGPSQVLATSLLYSAQVGSRTLVSVMTVEHASHASGQRSFSILAAPNVIASQSLLQTMKSKPVNSHRNHAKAIE